MVENLLYDELPLGRSAQLTRRLALTDLQALSAVSGDPDPAHLDPAYAGDTLFHGVIGQGTWSAALISTLLATQCPGPGTVVLGQDLQFTRPVRIGDTLAVKVTVTAKDDALRQVQFGCEVRNQSGEVVLLGTTRVQPPANKIRRARGQVPLTMGDASARRDALMALVRHLAPVRCAVVHPCDAESLRGAMDAVELGLMHAVLVGPEARIRALAEASGIDLHGVELLNAAHSHAAAELAVACAAQGQVQALMKGSLHTDELLHAVLAQPTLRTERRMSHVFRFDVPVYDKPLLVTDAALNIRPNLATKVDIVQNAIDFARLLGVACPKVAILAAVETVSEQMPSTLDAAAQCKMADRGQIRHALLDGPLAFDNAISPHAVRIKGIVSSVAGDADILAVPDIEAGNILAKLLEHFAGASGAGLVLGARVPIALTSRSDGPDARVTSMLLAQLVAAGSAAGAAAAD